MELNARAVAANLKKKNALLKKMLEIAKLQQDMLNGEDTPGVLRLMDERGRIIKKIDCLDLERQGLLALTREEPDDGLLIKTPEISKYGGQIKGAIKEMQKEDEKIKSAIRSKLEQYGKSAGKLREVKQTVSCYSAGGALEKSVYVDIKK